MDSEAEDDDGICISFKESSSNFQVARSSSLQTLLNSISSEREREKVEDGPILPDVTRGHFWTKLFHQSFLSERQQGKEVNGPKDDLLFFVRKRTINNAAHHKFKTEIEVYRWNNHCLPRLTDVMIDWEETVYLNLILQHFIYIVTVAVCTRTGPQEMQILKKFSQIVYASPSRRRMDSKGTEEEMTYPNIFFTLDNFEEVFADCIVRDSESICVELTAYDRCGHLQGVIFLGSIRYEALKQVYDTRASLSSRFALRMPATWFRGHRRVEFMRMRGPQNKGHAEMAVSRDETAPETPDPEGLPFRGFDHMTGSFTQTTSSAESSPVRRPSDPHGAGWRMWRSPRMRKSRSDSENIDQSSGIAEVEANSVEDEFDDSQNPNTTLLGRSFGQAWYWFKERRRASSVALTAYLTYITLPWHRIIADVLEVRQQPILTFDVS